MDSFQSCASCGRKLSPKFTECPYCHAALTPAKAPPATAAEPKQAVLVEAASAGAAPAESATVRKCPNCEAELEPGRAGCTTCGHGKPDDAASRSRLITVAILGGVVLLLVLVATFALRKLSASKEQERVVAAGGNTDDGQLLERVYAAFQAGDLGAYQKLSVTPADFLALQQADELAEQHERATGRKPNIVGRKLMAGQSFAGGVLAPEQRKLQEEDFRKVLAGGTGYIDFKTMKFKGVGTLVAKDEIPNLEGPSIPVRVFSVKVAGPAGDRDTRDLAPLFVVADFGGDPRLIGLRMP